MVGEPLTSISLYGGLAYFAIVRKSPFGTRQHFSEPLTAHDVQITFRRSWKLYGPGSTKMQHLSWKVQCFGPLRNLQRNHNVDRSKYRLAKGEAIAL